MQSKNVRYLPALDQLRALAALLVIFFHGMALVELSTGSALSHWVGIWGQSRNPLLVVVYEGHTGVALFMVLSGFVFTYGAFGRSIDYPRFLKNRLLRIYPLFLFLLMAGISIAPASFSLLGFLQTVLCLGNYPGRLAPDPYCAMSWTIAVEFQFYLIFPFLLRFLETQGTRWMFGVIILALCMRCLARIHGHNLHFMWYESILGRIDQFLAGMLAARLYLRKGSVPFSRRVLLFPALGLVLLSLFVYHTQGSLGNYRWWRGLWTTWEGFCWAFVLLAYLEVAASLPSLVSRPLNRLGEVSYSLYMLHYLVIMTIIKLRWHVPTGLPPFGDTLLNIFFLVLPATIALSFLTYHVIERPFLEMRVRYLGDKADTAVLHVPGMKRAA